MYSYSLSVVDRKTIHERIHSAFYDDVVKASYNELKKIFGDCSSLEEYEPGDKTHIDYILQCIIKDKNNYIIDKFYFTIYDYRQSWSKSKSLYYHIGAESEQYSKLAIDVLKSLYSNYNLKFYKETFNSDKRIIERTEYK